MLEGMDELAVRVGKQIKKARHIARMPQSELAEKVDVSLRAVQQWEAGERRCSLENLVQVAAVLEIGPAWLLGDLDVAPPSRPLTRGDIAQLEAKLDAMRALIEDRLPPRG